MHDQQSFGRAERQRAIGFLSIRLLIVLAIASVMLYVIAVAPGVPYHLRELFGDTPTPWQAVLFALMVLLALGPPALLGLQLIREPGLWAWLFPIGLLLHAALIFLVFRFATPIASVEDLVGLSVWPMPAELERLIRFVALFVVVSVSISGGTALLYAITRSFQPLRFLWWVLYAVLFLAVGYWIVVVAASTDNVTILLRGQANPLAWLALSLWMLLLAFGASLIAERVAGVFTGTGAALFALLLMLPLSYGALFLALEPRILGADGSGLSALEFLLSSSRSDYAFGALQLFGRYTLAYLAIMLLLTFAQYPVWVAYSTRRFARPTLGQQEAPGPSEGVSTEAASGGGEQR